VARVLIVDAYPRAGREALLSAGGSEAGELYRRVLAGISDALETEVVHPADGDRPGAADLGRFDGAVFTGSNLSILDAGDPPVARQVAFARDLQAAGVPSFGSCFALQIAAVSRGGRCSANPRGREFGVARDLRLSESGRAHPLYADKPARFDALTSHADHVTVLPAAAMLLCGNDWSVVQAAVCDDGPGTFFAVQYHPEYDLHEVASLARLRERELIDQGSFASQAELRAWVDDLEALHADPGRADLAQKLRLGPSVLDERERTVEVRNWLRATGLISPACTTRPRR